MASQHFPTPRTPSVSLIVEPASATPIDVRVHAALAGTGCDLIAVSGELDAATTPAATAALTSWLDRSAAPHFHIDLHDIGFIDAQGIGLLVDLGLRATVDDRMLTFHRPSGPVRRLIGICGLDSLLEASVTCPHVSAAVPGSASAAGRTGAPGRRRPHRAKPLPTITPVRWRR